MERTRHPSAVAIVTGASRGLGRALATTLVGDGWTVIGDGRDAARLAALARDLGPSFVAVPGDVTDPVHRVALVDRAFEIGRLDALVNNAGTLGPTPLPAVGDLRADDLTDTLVANAVAPAALARAALPLLRASRGTVVNITSDASVEAYEGWGAYGASKAALDHLTRVLAAEEPDLRAYAVDPGDMRTDMHQAAFPGEDISDRPEPDESVPGIVALLAGSLPSGRYREADLVAARRAPAEAVAT